MNRLNISRSASSTWIFQRVARHRSDRCRKFRSVHLRRRRHWPPSGAGLLRSFWRQLHWDPLADPVRAGSRENRHSRHRPRANLAWHQARTAHANCRSGTVKSEPPDIQHQQTWNSRKNNVILLEIARDAAAMKLAYTFVFQPEPEERLHRYLPCTAWPRDVWRDDERGPSNGSRCDGRAHRDYA